MIQGKDYLKNDKNYSSLLKPVKNPEMNNGSSEESGITKSNKSKIHDLFKQPAVKSSEVVPGDNISLYIDSENILQEESLETITDSEVVANNPVKTQEKDFKKDTAYKAIAQTQTAITVASTIAKLTNQDGFSALINSSSGVLTASKALIELDNAKTSENKTKTVISSLSQVANGVGTVLKVVDIPEAQFLTFTGSVLGLGVEQQDLSEKIEKKDARGIAGSSVSIAKGTWGAVLSGAEAAKLAVSLGHKSGVVSIETVGKVSTTASKISRTADKVAIPFAVAGSALNIWDLKNEYDKLASKKQELQKAREENLEIPEVIRMTKSYDEENLEKEVNTAKTNMAFRGVSAGLSLISTASLIVSVAYPPASSITKVITVGGSIASGLAGTFSDENKRETVINTYDTIKNKYNKLLAKIDNFVFSSKNQS